MNIITDDGTVVDINHPSDLEENPFTPEEAGEALIPLYEQEAKLQQLLRDVRSDREEARMFDAEQRSQDE